jgi:hypothetical protein
MGSLDWYAEELGRHGLMIPPFSNMGILHQLIDDHPRSADGHG